MAPPDDSDRSPASSALLLALGPLGHRINHPLGTARLAVDWARQISRESDRAEALAEPLDDIARCIDQAGNVTKALQRVARISTDPATANDAAPDWNRIVRAAVDTIGIGERLQVDLAREPMPVSIGRNSWTTLLVSSLRFLLNRAAAVRLRTKKNERTARLTADLIGLVPTSSDGAAWLDPFAAGSPVESLDDLALFVLHGVTLRHGGRLHLALEAQPQLTLELGLAN